MRPPGGFHAAREEYHICEDTMLKELLYQAVDWIASVHDWISSLNNTFEGVLSDKELHFIVIGVLGMLLIFAIYPLFKFLARTDHVMVVSWIYVFTLILVITFAIEIGQRMTRSGDMEFVDIVFGVGGFIVMFAVFALIRGIAKAIGRGIRSRKQAKQLQAKAAETLPEDTYQGRHSKRTPA